MKVQDVMTANLRVCGDTTNLASAAARMWEANCGFLPIVNTVGNVLGVVTDRDICIALGTRHRIASEIVVGEVMSRDVYSCAPADDVRRALEIMRERKVRRLPVLDADRKVRGIISLDDIALLAEPAEDAAVPFSHVAATLKAICDHGPHKATGAHV